MLVLTRKKNEKIVVNGNVLVEILSISSDQVKLGIVAPIDVIIDREELHLKRFRDKEYST